MINSKNRVSWDKKQKSTDHTGKSKKKKNELKLKKNKKKELTWWSSG